jgi:hypothetical protein
MKIPFLLSFSLLPRLRTPERTGYFGENTEMSPSLCGF